jgi:DNA-directed RNA polymerase alpha subunit
MKFLEWANGKYNECNDEFLDIRGSQYIQGNYGYNYPVYPKYNMSAHRNNYKATEIEFSTVVRANKYYVTYMYQHYIDRLDDEELFKVLKFFHKKVEEFTNDVNKYGIKCE